MSEATLWRAFRICGEIWIAPDLEQAEKAAIDAWGMDRRDTIDWEGEESEEIHNIETMRIWDEDRSGVFVLMSAERDRVQQFGKPECVGYDPQFV